MQELLRVGRRLGTAVEDEIVTCSLALCLDAMPGKLYQRIEPVKGIGDLHQQLGQAVPALGVGQFVQEDGAAEDRRIVSVASPARARISTLLAAMSRSVGSDASANAHEFESVGVIGVMSAMGVSDRCTRSDSCVMLFPFPFGFFDQLREPLQFLGSEFLLACRVAEMGRHRLFQ